MAAIPLSDAGRAVITKPPPWGKGYFIIKRASYPKGVTPTHLEGYVEKFTKAANECKKTLQKGMGKDTVMAFNECVGAKLRGGPKPKKGKKKK